MHLAVIAILAVVGLWWFSRSRTMFHLSVRAGRVLVVSGRVPGGVLREFRDVFRGTTMSGSVRALRQEHGSRIVTSGIDPRTTQRLRNVFGQYPASKFRQAPAIERPTMGQLLGIAWLAWFLEDISGRS